MGSSSQCRTVMVFELDDSKVLLGTESCFDIPGSHRVALLPLREEELCQDATGVAIR